VAYMGPERFSADPRPVKASDVWSLGASLFELLTGDLPFCGMGGGMLNSSAVVPNAGEDFSPELNDVVRACLAKEPWERPMASELAKYAEARLNGERPAMPWLDRLGGQQKEHEPKLQPNGKQTKREEPFAASKEQPVTPKKPISWGKRVGIAAGLLLAGFLVGGPVGGVAGVLLAVFWSKWRRFVVGVLPIVLICGYNAYLYYQAEQERLATEQARADSLRQVQAIQNSLRLALRQDSLAKAEVVRKEREEQARREREEAKAREDRERQAAEERKRQAEQQQSIIASIRKNMVFVKGGTFMMGATSEQGSDVCSNEEPAHQVTLSDFYIGKHEVTQAQWKAVMGSNPSHFKGDNLPVERVSWKDCQTFIRKLNELTGLRFRLPTEAEWEYTARGGNRSRGYKYSGGDDLGSVGWYYGNSGNKTHPVGQKRANELGLHDMSGNVCEWCSDWYGDYSSFSQTNPTGPVSGKYRVIRGGDYSVRYFLCSYFCRCNGVDVTRGGFFTRVDDRHGLRLVLAI